MKQLITLSLLLCVMLVTSVSAQNKGIISARYGINTKALSGVVFLKNANAVEGMFSISHDGSRALFTGFYEEYFPIGNSEKFTWYMGAGMHAGFTKNTVIREEQNLKYGEVIEVRQYEKVERKFLTGADAIIGMNYRFGNSPFTVGVDIKPSVDFINGTDMLVDGGVRLGFTF